MRQEITAEEYLKDPCGASSLPFWKTEQTEIPQGMQIVPEDQFDAAACKGTAEPYFRLICRPAECVRPEIPEGFELAACSTEEYAQHINSCYEQEGVTIEEVNAWRLRPVYDPELWSAVKDRKNKKIAATGIAEIDRRIGEGILEWIQVSPEYRRRGLGQYVVKELLYRMKEKAGFVTVSGKMKNENVDTAALSYAMTVHSLVDRQMDMITAGLSDAAGVSGLTKDMTEYIQWFCKLMEV